VTRNDEFEISEGRNPPAHREDHACVATLGGGQGEALVQFWRRG